MDGPNCGGRIPEGNQGEEIEKNIFYRYWESYIGKRVERMEMKERKGKGDRRKDGKIV
jgi:hypothetical protein